MKQRNISLDVLRILIMFMIVAGHALYHGGILKTVTPFSIEYYIANFIEALLVVHVNCFVLLSGYFLSKKQFSFKRIFLLWGQMLFWSVLLFAVIFILNGSKTIDVKEVVKSFLPFTQQRYWFMTTYLLMYILVPFLNAAIEYMPKRKLQCALAMWFSVFVLLQNVFFWRNFTYFEIRSPLFFAFLYLVGAYIRKYGFSIKIPWVWGYILFTCVITLSQIVLDKLGITVFLSPDGRSLLYAYNSVTVVLSSVCFFMVFLNHKITYSSKLGRITSLIAPLTLGVYLIHDHPNVREYIWEWLHPSAFSHSGIVMIIIVFVDVALIFCVACLMEKIRIYIAHKIATLIFRNKSTT
ncbi:hypothetical protein B5G06_11810 [Flavonifractor sp. An52]|uniref:acyltransferase n=1 Tax=Flavonifractor sp. An52 TaxID=1965642 RepID=UPI000B37F104|nr:acyltransferase [Flavonifractor sp. An52]OUN80295.1 hypothetical protein B5G06_11810 [Flavonifractor sp. An52]